MSYSWFQTSKTGGQRYSDTSPFSIPWLETNAVAYNVWSFFKEIFFIVSQQTLLESSHDLKQRIHLFFNASFVSRLQVIL